MERCFHGQSDNKASARVLQGTRRGFSAKAITRDHLKFNVIQERNGFVLHVIENRSDTRSTLDVGCGTGDLVCDIARRGIAATGIDFADGDDPDRSATSRAASSRRPSSLAARSSTSTLVLSDLI